MIRLPKLSIVVPVYMVEPYLKKCVQSLLNQTFTDIEIILVDDGSPDKCGDICDEFARSDQRVRVIHKANGGLSSARNVGVGVAKGEYIGFVDSDDWVAKEMYEKLINAAEKADADIACCGIYHVKRGQTSVYYAFEHDQIFEHDEAVKKVLLNHFKSFAWNKIYKKKLFEGLRYPVGWYHEDLALTYLLYERAKRMVGIKDACYYYLRRSGSITFKASAECKYHDFYFWLKRECFAYERYPDIFPACRLLTIKAAISAYSYNMAADEDSFQKNAKVIKKYLLKTCDDKEVFTSLKIKQQIWFHTVLRCHWLAQTYGNISLWWSNKKNA
jgi:glycosyltransferase involved in cell wall biosynthesis